MPSSIFMERAYRFAENLNNHDVKHQIEHYIRQSDFEGPLVSFIGAEGRGKSTLFGKATQLSPAPSAFVKFAGVASWKKAVGEMSVTNSIFHRMDEETVGDILLCDGPTFDRKDLEKVVLSLLNMTDLAVFAVQITQPAGADEVAFVRNNLANIPSVLVLTKCDQADEDDFQEGLEAVLENYSEFPWLAVLVSDMDGTLTETTAHDQSLINFERWWKDTGRISADDAKRLHLERLNQQWRSQAKLVLDSKENEYRPQLVQVTESLASNSNAAQALHLQNDLIDSLDRLPELALTSYRRHLTALDSRVNTFLLQCTNDVHAGVEINQSFIEKSLASIYKEWDEETRYIVRDDMSDDVERLHETATQYEGLVKAAINSELSIDRNRLTVRRPELVIDPFDPTNDVDLPGDFALTASDRLQTAATPAITALGAGLVIFEIVGATIFWPFAAILAITAAGAMGGGMFSSMNGTKRLSKIKALEKAVRQDSVKHAEQLQFRFRAEWKQFSDDVRDSMSASKRQMNMLLMRQSSAEDSILNEKFTALSSNLETIENLRRDLRWLEEYEQSSKLVNQIEG